jgi:hypothetical protein
VLYRGLPTGVALGAVLMEHDTGDPDAYIGRVTQGVTTAGVGVTAACAAIPVVGLAAAPVCATVWEVFGPDSAKFVNGLA